MTSSDPTYFEQRFGPGDAGRPSEVRTEYERDRARIIHSAAFRRLQGKTQVMGVGEGDFHRTRLTHSIECAQVGAGLIDQIQRSRPIPEPLRAWFPSKELIEAACFAHDLGHPPFGHGGELALFEKMRDQGGFEGNAHTLRILVRLEKHRTRHLGINPTRRLILAVLKYPCSYASFDLSHDVFKKKPPKCYFEDEAQTVTWAIDGFDACDQNQLIQCDSKQKPIHRTFDCSIMELADDIAYGVHDIEDIVARRLATKDEVATQLNLAFDPVGGTLHTDGGRVNAGTICDALFTDSYARKEMIGRLVNVFMTAVNVKIDERFVHPLLRFRASLPADHRGLLDKIRDMSHGLVINKPGVQQLERRGKYVIARVFSALSEDPTRMIQGFNDDQMGDLTSTGRKICDHVAGMTDSYSEKIYNRLFFPGFGSSHDEL